MTRTTPQPPPAPFPIPTPAAAAWYLTADPDQAKATLPLSRLNTTSPPMAKKKVKDGDPLGSLVAAGGQSGKKWGRVILGSLVLVVGAGLMLGGLLTTFLVPLMVTGGVLAAVGGSVVRSGVGFLPVHFEVRKRGIRYQTSHRDLELEWNEIESVFVQMMSPNVLLHFTGVGDAGEYIHKRADSTAFQVRVKTRECQLFSFTSGMLPPMTGRAVLARIAENLPASAVAYELFAKLPKLAVD